MRLISFIMTTMTSLRLLKFKNTATKQLAFPAIDETKANSNTEPGAYLICKPCPRLSQSQSEGDEERKMKHVKKKCGRQANMTAGNARAE